MLSSSADSGGGEGWRGKRRDAKGSIGPKSALKRLIEALTKGAQHHPYFWLQRAGCHSDFEVDQIVVDTSNNSACPWQSSLPQDLGLARVARYNRHAPLQRARHKPSIPFLLDDHCHVARFHQPSDHPQTEAPNAADDHMVCAGGRQS